MKKLFFIFKKLFLISIDKKNLKILKKSISNKIFLKNHKIRIECKNNTG
jgi:hypothetical protein